MKQKVFCEDCKWCCHDGSYECRNKRAAEVTKDTFLKKGEQIDYYASCWKQNMHNNCKLFEKKDLSYYLFLQFWYYASIWYGILAFLFVCSVWIFMWICGFEYISQENL